MLVRRDHPDPNEQAGNYQRTWIGKRPPQLQRAGGWRDAERREVEEAFVRVACFIGEAEVERHRLGREFATRRLSDAAPNLEQVSLGNREIDVHRIEAVDLRQLRVGAGANQI